MTALPGSVMSAPRQKIGVCHPPMVGFHLTMVMMHTKSRTELHSERFIGVVI